MSEISKAAEWLVIVNPNAGLRAGEKDWPEINQLLIDYGFDFDAIYTEKPFHGIELSRKMIQEKGYTKVIAVGGDGTLNEVVNGIFQQDRYASTDITLGMITVGTGNDWARMYSFPKKYKKAIKILRNELTFLQDVGKVKYRYDSADKNRYFVNMAGMGYDALVAKKTNLMKAKGRGGTFLYLFNLLTGLFQYEATLLNVLVDGSQVYDGRVFSMSIGICKYNGGGMMQLPNAIPDDGLLDVTLIKKTTKFRIVSNIKHLYDGSFVNMPEVLTFTGKRISITATPRHSIYLETDGESLGTSPLDFEIVPKAVKLIVRRKALKQFGSE
jgi:YegS/Rv2252/BmrU family lipid kinase